MMIKAYRGAMRRSRKIAVMAAFAILIPGQVWAQALECPANIVVGFDGETTGQYELNEPIPIEVTFEMGFTGIPSTLNVSHFEYLLDCEDDPTKDFLDCKFADPTPGNTVVLNEASVATDCTTDGVEAAVLVTTEQGVIQIDFDVQDQAANPSSIELASAPDSESKNSCSVTFEVIVTELSGLNATKEIVEFAGFGGSDAACDFGDLGIINSGSTDPISFQLANPNSVFWVTKDFTDDNPSKVDVHFRCDTGTILNPDFSELTDKDLDGTFDTVGFIVYGIPSIGANCTIYEEPIPTGYSPSYVASARQGAIYDDLGELEDDAGCFYEGVNSGEFDCDITNTPKPAEFTVYKEWLVYGDGGQEVLEEAVVTISCDREIFETKLGEDADENEVEGVVFPPGGLQDDWLMVGTLGDGEFMTAKVDTETDEAKCFVTEEVAASGVESTDNCKVRSLGPGESSECKFINTVFFEGIPTLNQYGIALMALLILTFGTFAFRRFV